MNNYLIILDIIGISAFTISGFLIAIKSKLDLLGIFLISFITALGGGIIRDMILQRQPFSFTEIYPIITVLTTIYLSYLLKFHIKVNIDDLNNNKIYNISDSIGLVFFSIIGANLALKYNFNFMGIMLLSLITATGGGILRDISLNQVPSIFKEGFYGSISIIIGFFVFIENYFKIYFGIDQNIYLIINLFIGLIIRFLVLKYKIEVPKFN